MFGQLLARKWSCGKRSLCRRNQHPLKNARPAVGAFLRATRIFQSTLIFSFVSEKVLEMGSDGLRKGQIYASAQGEVTSMHRSLVLRDESSGEPGRTEALGNSSAGEMTAALPHPPPPVCSDRSSAARLPG